MRIVQLNLAWDPAVATPERLLDRFHTLTGWSDALSDAGAMVHVVQRFSASATVLRGRVVYEFVADGLRPTLPPWSTSVPAIAAISRAAPDVVHVNGLMFPGMVCAVREQLAGTAAVVLQDHSGMVPAAAPWPIASISARRWRRALRGADACTFTAHQLARRWHRAGLPREVPVLEIPEASTTLRPMNRDEARAQSGMLRSPAILWVGRLDANKDPLTVLDGLDLALRSVADAGVTMVVPGGGCEESVRRRIAQSPVLRDRVTLAGPVPHARMTAYYSAADVFVSGSRHEGSGYALIESMACGVVPCVTDIPAFRALTGDCGARWTAGDASSFAASLRVLLGADLDAARAAVRNRFAESISWNAIGRRTLDAYRALAAARAHSRP